MQASIYIIIALLAVFIGSMILIMLGYPQLLSAVRRHESHVKTSAAVNLPELFLFIEPQKIYLINLVVLSITLLLVWIITEHLILAVITSVIVGWSPKLIYNYLRSKRNDRFIKDLPDALLNISNMMKAGTSLNVALDTMISETKGPISQEFGLFMRELRVGIQFDEALDNINERMKLEELQLVVAGMKISREVGGSLADVLGRLSDTLRRKIEMEGKIKSLTAQGKIQGYVMTGLPFLIAFVLFHIEPEAMARLFSDPIGWGVCAFVIIFVTIGYKFIKKIVSIDV